MDGEESTTGRQLQAGGGGAMMAALRNGGA
jgi:hypothetical protein